ncbi:MAG: hypothetical protein ABSF55_01420 [Candidatus Staskawiczbacteria bacterium]|jgi:hypothetical protein
MKLKAVITYGCPEQLRDAIEGMRTDVMKGVIGPCLHRPSFGPAEFYIQRCDEAISEEGLCEVRLSGVSVTRDRSDKDFDDAAEVLEELYTRRIAENLPIGQRIQLMVSIMLDQPRRDGSSLVERTPVWVAGKGNPA